SAQFSTMVTRSVPPHAVGTALTLQTSLGFLLTMASIQLVPPLVALVGWRWAFAALAIGPALGIASIRRLQAGKAEGGGEPPDGGRRAPRAGPPAGRLLHPHRGRVAPRDRAGTRGAARRCGRAARRRDSGR